MSGVEVGLADRLKKRDRLMTLLGGWDTPERQTKRLGHQLVVVFRTKFAQPPRKGGGTL